MVVQCPGKAGYEFLVPNGDENLNLLWLSAEQESFCSAEYIPGLFHCLVKDIVANDWCFMIIICS